MVKILIPDTTRDTSKAQQLRSKLQAAVDALDAKSAWPTTCGDIEIAILNNAEDPQNFDTDFEVAHMGVVNQSVGRLLERGIWRQPGTLARIAVSVDIQDDGIAKSLRGCVPESEILTFMLAHEIHHLTEIERQQECGISHRQGIGGFAAAARPNFPKKWRDAVIAYSREYKSSKRPGALATAEAIADEAAADLVGLYWMNQCFGAWKPLAERLIATRKKIWEDGQNAVPPRRYYDIHGALEQVLLQGLPVDTEAIYECCWDLAVASALHSGALPAKLRKVFADLRPLKLPRSPKPGAAVIATPRPL